MRIVAWNIRAGGGERGLALAAQLRRFRPDLAALSEFRATPPSVALAQALADLGLRHQLTTCDAEAPNANCLLVASRWPLDRLRTPRGPEEPGRWLLARVGAPRPFSVGAMHVPNRLGGRKWPFLDAVLRLAERWRGGPALLVGDTNSGRPGIDEESPAFNACEGGWIDALERAGWRDAFRHRRGQARAYTWYSPNAGNGFRIDQAFVNPELLSRLTGMRYDWGRRAGVAGRAAGLSDHAAVVLDFGDGPGPVPAAVGRNGGARLADVRDDRVAAADPLPAGRGGAARGSGSPGKRYLPLAMTSASSVARELSSGLSRSSTRRASSSRPSLT